MSLKFLLVVCVLVASSLMSCKSEKLLIPAYLDINFYDKFDHKVDSLNINFFYGSRPINSFFEYKNDSNATNVCNEQIKKITSSNIFSNSFLAAKNYYLEKDLSKLYDFNRVDKVEFECRVTSKDSNSECLTQLLLNISHNYLYKNKLINKNLSQLSPEEKENFREEVNSEFFLKANVLKACDYKVVKEPQYFYVKDLLR